MLYGYLSQYSNIQYIRYLLLMCLCINLHQSHANSIYKKIRSINLASLEWKEEEWPNESFYDYLSRCFKYQKDMQDLKKRKVVFNLFDSFFQKQYTSCNSLHDSATIHDLNLLSGKTMGDDYVGTIINRTYTELGRVFLYGLIGNPIDDIHELKNRQAIIKLLLKDDQLYQSMGHLLKEFASSENFLLSCWSQDGFLQSAQRRYFNIPFLKKFNTKCNKSIKLLQAKLIYNHYERMIFLFGSVIAAVLLPVYSCCKITGMAFLPDYLTRVAERLQGSGGKIFALISGLLGNDVAIGSISLFVAFFSLFGLKEEYEWMRDNFFLDDLLQKKMIHVASCLKNIEKLAGIISECPELIEQCSAAQTIDTFMHTEFLTPEMQQLFNVCKSSTLQDNSSIFSIQGRVLLAFRLLYDLKDKIAPLLIAVGELDAYFSCARLYKEFENKPIGFCFTEYKIDNHPSIVLTDFWNPLIDSSGVITNVLNLNSLEKRSIILTGPNAGGKSTLIKAIAISLILSQSIGLAPAKCASITPFYAIATYLNVVDDIAKGNSLFKAQLFRAQEVITLVENTPQNKFSFVALDEMFNGTSYKESMAAAYSVVEHIAGFQNNISIVATHFPLLTSLETSDSPFKNYKVSVVIDENNQIHYPFKLQEGISFQHIALDILKNEGYSEKIIKKAINILNAIQ